MAKKAAAKLGDSMTVEYSLRLQDGKVVDQTRKGRPLVFTVGDGSVIAGFESAVACMSAGEEKEFTLKPEDAYGVRRVDLVKKIPRMMVPNDRAVRKGDVFGVNAPEGSLSARVVDVDERVVVLDANHPLAGAELTFKVKVLKIEPKKDTK
jgi:FKBP-type peptidyl-prolyl cis-trans isomerase 2